LNRKFSPSKVSHDRWLVSYADFITLLFAFFVVLFAFAKAGEKKQIQVASAIDSAFRALSIAPSAQTGSRSTHSSERAPIATAQSIPDATVRADLDHIRRDLEQRLAVQIANRVVTLQLGENGLVISLREAGFFESGSATPKPETTPTLHQIAEALRDTPYDVCVEGHTDNMPVHNAEFDSNWELSAARAVRITRMFLDLHVIRPDQLSAEGFAEYRPIADNRSALGRAENRRVDIVVTPRFVLDLSPPASAKDQREWRKITDP